MPIRSKSMDAVAPGSNAATHSTANYLLEGLTEIGIEYLFCNFGTDHAPIIEELSGRRKRGLPSPKTIRCPHESTAAHMAAGYALISGKGQGVLVHVDVGTANAAAAMHNLFRSRIPVLLMAGKAPFTTAGELLGSRDTYVHFIQEPFDQGSLVRPYVKWEWTLPSGVIVKEALQRANSIMESGPKGPVYLMLPREILTESWNEAEVRLLPQEQFGALAPGGADPEFVGALADRLLAAEHPILVTSYAGRNAQASDVIGQLASFAGIAVYDDAMANLAGDTPCLVGGAPGPALAAADLGLMVDVDVPWIPRDAKLRPGSYWAQIDVDALKGASPLWTFPCDARLQGDSTRILRQLLSAVRDRATPAFRAAAAARVDRIDAERGARQQRATELAANKGRPGAINPHFFCAELSKLLDPADIVFNEAVRNAQAVGMQLARPLAGTLLRNSGGGLGASGGMALGAKLAAPERLVTHIVGDGTFYFNNPSSMFAVAKHYDLPILTIVLDNAGWSAVKHATLQVFPDGEAKEQGGYEADLPDADLAAIGAAFGAHGERLEDPAEVPAALARCIAAVRSGRSAVLHVRVTPI
jgi:acetolactate synthase-1/2/3 large subunit